MSKQTVVKGAAYIYIETVISMVAGYGFWIVVSQISPAGVVGTASAAVSLATIFATIATIGANVGVQRFLAKSFSEQKFNQARVFVKASFILILTGIVASIVAFTLGYHWIYSSIRMTTLLAIVFIILVISTVIMTLLRYIVIASLRTRILPMAMIFSTILKIAIAVALVVTGLSSVGVMTGFTVFPVIASLIFFISLLPVFAKRSTEKPETGLGRAFRSILEASIPTWIPFSIYTIGIHLGPLSVFSAHGANEAGIYSMAFFIAVAISSTTSALFSIAYPAMSAMEDGRKRFAWRATKMSLLISIPFSTSLIFYSKDVMGLFGSSYISSASSLEVLLATMAPVAVTAGVSTLVYSYGNYKHVMAIGLATNLPRVALYFLLVPIYESTGAAMSYSIGSIAGFVMSIIIARNVGMAIYWKELLLLSLIPAILAYIMSYLQLNYILGIVLTLLISYLCLFKLRVMSKEDVQDSMLVLPYGLSGLLQNLWLKIWKKGE
jgi:O-antigen/teichoic acid export membrane protein